ncbi:3746_t:CDS:2 [Entrophospora sp. SA101]|nr:3746_t:CDS:2 [Entrophospora sp. SA101]
MDEDMDEESGGDYSDDSNELDYDTLGLFLVETDSEGGVLALL